MLNAKIIKNMHTKESQLHKFKQEHIRTKNYSTTHNRFAHVLYRFVPNILFNSQNRLLSLFTNGLAVLVAKVVSNVEYVERYFDIKKLNK